MVVAGKPVAQQIIEPGVEAPPGYFLRVVYLQCSRGGVARIGKQRFLIIGTFGVETFEFLPWHKDLASYLKLIRPVSRLEL